ncbi:MAG: alpha/beta hydrolase [Saprospiraceae bacterium]|nr:alpha/beta hydrolase [Saprospiraceae bacterium]HMW40012.1 alpha/beta hydrolase [Saprospiraceae bacterium]HMX89581.1 alpha/beta hydrolase [Saprospiraceae bacterium]HMZ41353.1 alpha/beta hydrolase [Saprospiraceae bacterium]HNA65681.1 alpha/beta hydrolase [Saprospiraceae bacterium]
MKIHRKSHFKDLSADHQYFQHWVSRLENLNQRKYEQYSVITSLGKTVVWGLNTLEDYPDTLVIFPGARTTSLIWDFDKGLDHFNHRMRIFLVETNGLPNLSDGATPDIKSLDYGFWASEVLQQLGIENAYVAGASFGGLICMKLCLVRQEKIKSAFLLNPGCLQPFSLSLRNLYYNLLPLIKPNKNNVLTFLNKAVFSAPNHRLSPEALEMLVDYEVFAITRYVDRTQKPYYMDKQLEEVTVDTYLLLGNQDLLFPFQKSVANAKRQIRSLKDIQIFNHVGHGIETYDKALNYVGQRIRQGL